MKTIKKNIKLFTLMLMVILISGGIYYFNVILSSQLEKIQVLKYQNGEKRLKLQYLQQELNMLPEKEKELLEMQRHVQELRDKMPTYDTSVRIMMKIMQYLEMSNFQDLDINIAEAIKQENEVENYYKVPITIKYTTTYDNAMNFLEDINRSYQMITVDYFSIDNSVQEQTNQEGNRILSGDAVSTELVLWLYYTDSDEKKETYPNFTEFVGGEDNVFLRPSVWEDEEKTKE